MSSTKWKLLTKEQRQEYNEKATQADSQTMSQKKEMRRVLSNLSNLVCKPNHDSFEQCAKARCCVQIAKFTLLILLG